MLRYLREGGIRPKLTTHKCASDYNNCCHFRHPARGVSERDFRWAGFPSLATVTFCRQMPRLPSPRLLHQPWVRVGGRR